MSQAVSTCLLSPADVGTSVLRGLRLKVWLPFSWLVFHPHVLTCEPSQLVGFAVVESGAFLLQCRFAYTHKHKHKHTHSILDALPSRCEALGRRDGGMEGWTGGPSVDLTSMGATLAAMQCRSARQSHQAKALALVHCARCVPVRCNSIHSRMDLRKERHSTSTLDHALPLLTLLTRVVCPVQKRSPPQPFTVSFLALT